MTKIRPASYKPLLFTTTMRNPERMKHFLAILKRYDGQILTNDVIAEICIDLIRQGLYRPMRGVSETIKSKWENETELSKAEAQSLYTRNPQEHKEAGFDRGWPSRFQTMYQLAKELGFADYAVGNPIKISDTGNLLLQDLSMEQIVFANAFAKYQTNNPFRRVANENVPLVLLLQVISLLKETNAESAGVSRKEIPLLLCWRDNNALALRDKILDIREKYGFTPSDEVIVAECRKLINTAKRNEHSLTTDYPDDFIRKMKLTGLITIRGFGRFIDINQNEMSATQYILSNYSDYKKYPTEAAYSAYMGQIDERLRALLTKSGEIIKSSRNDLLKWANYYKWDSIKSELIKLTENRNSSDDILKFIDRPLRLEFLTSLAIVANIENVEVIPNYIVDDEGLPSSHAPGNSADIECREVDGNALVEATLLTGTAQHMRESMAITRHLDEYVKQGNPSAYTLFVSPKTFIDTIRYIRNIKTEENLDIAYKDIPDFIVALEQHNTLREVAFA